MTLANTTGRHPQRDAGPFAVLADDDVDFALEAVDVLRGCGFTVEFVSNGAQALERALGSHPDIVLLDQLMPQMTGSEVVAALARVGFRAPVVLMSASADMSALQRQTGARYLLAKPFGVEDLLRTIRQALADSRAASTQRHDAAITGGSRPSTT